MCDTFCADVTNERDVIQLFNDVESRLGPVLLQLGGQGGAAHLASGPGHRFDNTFSVLAQLV